MIGRRFGASWNGEIERGGTQSCHAARRQVECRAEVGRRVIAIAVVRGGALRVVVGRRSGERNHPAREDLGDGHRQELRAGVDPDEDTRRGMRHQIR